MEVKCAAISDIHGYLGWKIEPCDILFVVGDLCPDVEAIYQIDWINRYLVDRLLNQPVSNIVFTAGNHDFGLQYYRDELILPENIHCLIDQDVTIDRIKIYGTPWTPQFGNWAFMRQDPSLGDNFSLIPEDADVIISHGPPFGYLDPARDGRSVGSKSLLNKLNSLKNKPVVLCGHIHNGYGKIETENFKLFNCSYVNEQYKPANQPHYFKLVAS